MSPRRRTTRTSSARRRTRRIKSTSGRRKTSVSRRRKNSVAFEMHSQVSREVWGIVWIAFSVLNFFALNDSAGVFGEWLKNKVLLSLFGMGAPMIPFVFVLVGISYLLFERVSFRSARLVGLFLFVTASLGIVQLSAPIDSFFDDAPNYGGYLGFVIDFFAMSFLGVTTTFFLMGAIIIASMFFIFQISIRNTIMGIFHFARSVHGESAKTPQARSYLLKEKKSRAQIKEYDDEEADELDDDVVIVRGIEKAIEQAATKQVVDPESDDVESVRIQRDRDEIKKKLAEAVPLVRDNTKFSLNKQAYISHEYADWKFPPTDLLTPQAARSEQDDDKLLGDAETIRKKLLQFNIGVTMKDIHVGPTVIQYTLKPAEDVKLSKITSLKNDLALSLAAHAIRIEAPIPGKSLVGIEIPTAERATVMIRDVIESKEFQSLKDPLRFAFGRDVTGKPICASLVKMPHLLVAGQTGSGKSVAVNSFLISLMYKHSPADLKLILIDPKRVEMEGYNGIPHLLTPVITEPEKALKALKWCVAEMTRRYKELSSKRKRNIVEYNDDPNLENMPYIVIVVDELADLMMAAPKEIEATICRLAQMARAVGIHLIIATQRPSVDVITGLIKANIPTRIAFTVATGIDSRTILDGIGAEDLLNKGDMLYLASDLGKPLRVQGVYVDSEEIERVINHVKLNSPDAVEYLDEITEGDHKVNIPGVMKEGVSTDSDEGDLQKALDVIKEHRKASASLLQRRCSFGYAKAARILDELEEMGMIGPSNGAKPREIFIEE